MWESPGTERGSDPDRRTQARQENFGRQQELESGVGNPNAGLGKLRRMRENLDRREQKNGEGKRVTKTVAQKIEALSLTGKPRSRAASAGGKTKKQIGSARLA
jgi:hypothetical protein